MTTKRFCLLIYGILTVFVPKLRTEIVPDKFAAEIGRTIVNDGQRDSARSKRTEQNATARGANARSKWLDIRRGASLADADASRGQNSSYEVF